MNFVAILSAYAKLIMKPLAHGVEYGRLDSEQRSLFEKKASKRLSSSFGVRKVNLCV